MSVLQKLTEGIVHRDVTREGAAMLTKWEQTGLLEGITDERTKNSMAVLLENQAKELLRESSAMAAGDVEGFASVAFPIVRRVFGGLIANDIVSVQPMSLPSGLIFFLDFTKSTDIAGANGVAPLGAGESVYGGKLLVDRDGGGNAEVAGVTPAVGRDIIDGVDISGDPGGFYNLAGNFSSATSIRILGTQNAGLGLGNVAADAATTGDLTANANLRVVRHDPDVLAGGLDQEVFTLDLAVTELPQINLDLVREATVGTVAGGTAGNGNNGAPAGMVVHNSGADLTPATGLVRRLTSVIRCPAGHALGEGTLAVRFVFIGAANQDADGAGCDAADLTHAQYPIKDAFASAGQPAGLGAIAGQDVWGLEGADEIPEIDIKVDSIAVTAQTKKLKAKWTPELAQDLNAYHSLDAEVELTGILSEQIALEIDQEILGDLVDGATAGTLYWSRSPGQFVNRQTGAIAANPAAPPDFTGTVSEWYETLVETINDVSAQIHRKTLRGGANFLVCSPEVANILEFTSGFRASVTADQDRGSVGAVKVGSVSKKFDVMVDPYFPRNVILVGRKGSSFLESGYVYAPYVPLQTTPTIFGPEDFVPRKGVMTRYAKQMVRPDMYGLVICRDLLG